MDDAKKARAEAWAQHEEEQLLRRYSAREQREATRILGYYSYLSLGEALSRARRRLAERGR